MPSKKTKCDDLVQLYPTLGDAYRLKGLLNNMWTMPKQGWHNLFKIVV